MTARRFPKLAACGLAVLLAVALAARLGAAADPTPTATLSGFYLSGFGLDGYKSWDIQGREAQASIGEATQADIAGLLLRIFSGGEKSALEMSITSSQASIVTANGAATVSGPDILYINAADGSYSVTGYQWEWNSDTQTIKLGRGVVVTFSNATKSGVNMTAEKSPQPIIILSDSLSIEQKLPNQPNMNRFTFDGNVSIADKQSSAGAKGEFHTTCDSLVVVAARASAGGTAAAVPTQALAGKSSAPVASLAVGPVQSIIASGNVISRQDSIEARGGQAVIFPGENKVTLSDAPQIQIALAENATDTNDQALIEGGRIDWLRDQQQISVVPAASDSGTPGQVKVTLPSNSPMPPGAPAAHLGITGGSLQMQYDPAKQRRFDIDSAVEVKDPRYTIQAQHLDAEFDPPTPPSTQKAPAAAAPSDQLLAVEKPVPQLGKLNHLGLNGGVTLFQDNLKATTPQAEVSPADDLISLTGGAHVEDSLSNVTMDASTVKLATDGSHASIFGEAGKPAQLKLPSLPLGENTAQNIETTIVSDSVEMQRGLASDLGKDYSSFTFGGNVQVNASSLEMTSGQLDAYTYDVPSSTESDPTKRIRIAQLIAHDHVRITQPGFTALAATAEVNPQAGLNQKTDTAAPATDVKEFRLVQLKGDPQGVTGPVQPEVDVPMHNMDLGPDSGNTDAAATNTTAKISSDDQWLFTSPTANTYVFMGNVSIDVRDAEKKIFLATCDQMQVNCTQVKAPGDIGTAATIPHLAVDNIVAEKNVRIVQGDQGERISTADHALITPSQGKAVLSGNVVVLNNLVGSSLRYGDIVLTLTPGHLAEEIITPQGTPGQPIERPTITLPVESLHLDRYKNSAKKDSNTPTQ